jgi:hypothetical protein
MGVSRRPVVSMKCLNTTRGEYICISYSVLPIHIRCECEMAESVSGVD